MRIEIRDFLGIPINTYKQLGSVSDRNRNVQRVNTNQQPDTGVSVSTGTIKKAEELFKQGNDKLDKSDYQGAINSLTEAISLDPKFAEAYSLRGAAYSRSEDDKKAIDNWQKSANLFAAQGNNSASKRDQGRIRDLLKDYQGAIALYNEAIRLDQVLRLGTVRFIYDDSKATGRQNTAIFFVAFFC